MSGQLLPNKRFTRGLLLLTKIGKQVQNFSSKLNSLQQIIHFGKGSCLGRKKQQQQNLPIKSTHISENVLKLCSTENHAVSNLHLTNLNKVFQRDGEDGLLNTLISPNSEGQPRVTIVA